MFASCPLGTPQRRGSDPVPGQKALLRRVQVSQVQEKMDERQLLGQHGAGVHQVPHQRVPAQAGEGRGQEAGGTEWEEEQGGRREQGSLLRGRRHRGAGGVYSRAFM